MAYTNWDNRMRQGLQPIANSLVTYLKKGDTYIDIGSNTGVLMELIMERVSGPDFFESIIMVEPVEEYYNECVRKFNHLPNIKFENFAFSNDSEDKELYISTSNLGYNKIFKSGMDIHGNKKRTIKCNTFSEYAKLNNITHVDFIKIDAEGHDCEIIEGMIEWLHTVDKLPIILFEGTWYPNQENILIQKMRKEFGYDSKRNLPDIDIILTPSK